MRHTNRDQTEKKRNRHMKIFISEIDRQNARSVALKNIARHFNIPDWEFESNENLKNEIDNIDNPDANTIIRLLNIYFTAYDNWFNFYQEKKAIETHQEEEYQLTNAEQLELQELITRREATLAELQTEFDRLQLQRFNRNQFGADINGIINEDI